MLHGCSMQDLRQLSPPVKPAARRHSEFLRIQLHVRFREPRHKANLSWLAANLRFTLLLDEVGRKIEPAYRLKERWLQGEIDSQTLAQQLPLCRAELESAPVKELFQTYGLSQCNRGVGKTELSQTLAGSGSGSIRKQRDCCQRDN
jgi:hypothetical protein